MPWDWDPPFMPVWLFTPYFYELSYREQPTPYAKPVHVTGSSSFHCACCWSVGPVAELKSRDAETWGGLGCGRGAHEQSLNPQTLACSHVSWSTGCLQNANDQVRWGVRGRQSEPGMIYLLTLWRKGGRHHMRNAQGISKRLRLIPEEWSWKFWKGKQLLATCTSSGRDEELENHQRNHLKLYHWPPEGFKSFPHTLN